MKVRFTKSFAKDLRNHRRNQNLLQQVQKAIEQVEQAETTIELTNLKQLKAEGRVPSDPDRRLSSRPNHRKRPDHFCQILAP